MGGNKPVTVKANDVDITSQTTISSDTKVNPCISSIFQNGTVKALPSNSSPRTATQANKTRFIDHFPSDDHFFIAMFGLSMFQCILTGFADWWTTVGHHEKSCDLMGCEVSAIFLSDSKPTMVFAVTYDHFDCCLRTRIVKKGKVWHSTKLATPQPI